MTDEESKEAASILVALSKVPPDRRCDVLAIVVKVFVEDLIDLDKIGKK